MLIFFKNIPPTTKTNDLVSFIQPAITQSFFGRLFSLPATIVDIKLFDLLDHEENLVNVNGVVTIMPKEAAFLAIKQLDRKAVNGRRVTVREYHVRSKENDPRKTYGDIPQNIIDQRIGDRRKNLLVAW